MASTQFPSPAPNTSRPTLPPLSSLCLPDIRARRTNINVPTMQCFMNTNSNDLLPPLPLNLTESWPRARHSSVSSTTSSLTSSSRASSPTEAWHSRRESITRTVRRHHPYLGGKYRVVLTDKYENADAMLVLPLPLDAVDENNTPIPEKLKEHKGGKAYLVIGPLVHQLRDPQNRARLRAAIHPYRIIPRNPQTSSSNPNATPINPSFPQRRDSASSDSSDFSLPA